MTTISSVAELVNRFTGGNNGNPETYFWNKDTTSLTFTAGTFKSLWLADGKPGPGVAPGAVSNPTGATAGALRVTDPGGGRQRWLRSMGAAAWTACRVILYDRLLHISGLSGTVTTAQTVGGSLTRYTGQESLGNFIFVEVYQLIGATATTVTANYVDKDGNARTTGSHPIGSTPYRQVGDALILPYATDTGANSVTSVTNVTLASTTAAAGNFGVTIGHPLLEIDLGSVDSSAFGHGAHTNVLEDIEIKSGACLGLLVMSTGTTNNYFRGNYTSVER